MCLNSNLRTVVALIIEIGFFYNFKKKLQSENQTAFRRLRSVLARPLHREIHPFRWVGILRPMRCLNFYQIARFDRA